MFCTLGFMLLIVKFGKLPGMKLLFKFGVGGGCDGCCSFELVLTERRMDEVYCCCWGVEA